MKICILTQTATDISDYYKGFFEGYDLYFVTFKTPNKNAVDFLPKSTWSAGRNRLWEEVKGKYDYYLFIDDDLVFYRSMYAMVPQIHYLLENRYQKPIEKLYKEARPGAFFNRLSHYLKKYSPDVLTVRNLNNQENKRLDLQALRAGNAARRLGWFDAQFTLFSNYAAQRLLPYDTKISGWASAQILIYLLSHEVFGPKAMGLIDLGVNNSFHTGAYVTDYKSNLDCKNMVEEICKSTAKDFKHLFDTNYNHVNLYYGDETIAQPLLSNEKIDFAANFTKRLKGIETLMDKNNLSF